MSERLYFKAPIAVFVLLFFLFYQNVLLAVSEFYIYKNNEPDTNHFLSVAKTGDFENLIHESYNLSALSEDGNCIKISYTPCEIDKHNWTSISWMVSDTEKENAYDLQGAKRIAFYAKGEEGGETVQFDSGAISYENGHLSGGSTGAVVLSGEWREYSIDLDGADLSLTKIGFSCTINKFDNPQGAVIYLDEIKYEFWD